MNSQGYIKHCREQFCISGFTLSQSNGHTWREYESLKEKGPLRLGIEPQDFLADLT